MYTGIVNGMEGVMHSLSWYDSSYELNLRECKAGQLVMVPFPYSVNIKVAKHKDPIPMCAFPQSHDLPGGKKDAGSDHKPISNIFVCK